MHEKHEKGVAIYCKKLKSIAIEIQLENILVLIGSYYKYFSINNSLNHLFVSFQGKLNSLFAVDW